MSLRIPDWLSRRKFILRRPTRISGRTVLRAALRSTYVVQYGEGTYTVCVPYPTGAVRSTVRHDSVAKSALVRTSHGCRAVPYYAVRSMVPVTDSRWPPNFTCLRFGFGLGTSEIRCFWDICFGFAFHLRIRFDLEKSYP